MSRDPQAELTRLRGQRLVLADLLEKSVVVLQDLKETTDDAETRGELSDLIHWSTQAVKGVRTEQMLVEIRQEAMKGAA